MVATSIAELLVGEGLAGLGIARRTHQVEQIARRRILILAGGAALGHQHGDERRPALAEAGAGEDPAGSASPAAAADRGNAVAPAARHTPSRSRARRRRGDPSRTRTWCVRRSRASSAASPRADRPARCWRPCSFAIVSSVTAIMCGTSVVTARGVKAGASVRRWCFQARPSAISRPSPSIGRSTRRPAGVRGVILVIVDQHMPDRSPAC